MGYKLRIILFPHLHTCENPSQKKKKKNVLLKILHSFIDEEKVSKPYAKAILDSCTFMFNFFLRRV